MGGGGALSSWKAADGWKGATMAGCRGDRAHGRGLVRDGRVQGSQGRAAPAVPHPQAPLTSRTPSSISVYLRLISRTGVRGVKRCKSLSVLVAQLCVGLPGGDGGCGS